jgi:hypothetical protein
VTRRARQEYTQGNSYRWERDLDIEIHVDCQGLRDFFEMVSGGADGWDGSEPLRPVEG